MRDEARERDTQFRETGQQTFGGRVTERRSGDDTYGTNVMSIQLLDSEVRCLLKIKRDMMQVLQRQQGGQR